MLLVIDLGNANIKLGLYQGESLRRHWRLATDQARMPDEYGLQILGMLGHGGYRPEDLTGICLSSVVPPLSERMVLACQTYLKRTPLLVTSAIKLGYRNVFVMPQGILGWKKAGKPIEKS